MPYHQWGPASTLARAKQPPGKHHLQGKCPGKYLASGTCRPLLVVGMGGFPELDWLMVVARVLVNKVFAKLSALQVAFLHA